MSPRRIVDFLSSYGLACILLFGLFVLTLVGTLDQAAIGLHAAQQKYFFSMIVWLERPGWPAVPVFPGGYLLMALLTVNLVLGGVVRLRRTPSRIGMFIVHAGMVLMLVGGMITYHFAVEGQMALEPGQTSSRFQSATEWELAVIDTSHPERDVEYLIPQAAFTDLAGRVRTFSHEGLPFELDLGGYLPNSEPRGRGGEILLQPLHPNREQGGNWPGLTARVRQGDGPARESILWGRSLHPWAFEAGGRTWALELRRRQFHAPFSLTLERFVHEFHPGTRIARTYESDVIKTEGDRTEAVNIRMNEPLRHGGYTFFQSSYYQIPDSEQYGTVLAVVRNPADQFPLWATLIVTAGLLLHFSLQLARYLKREMGERGERVGK